MTPDEREIIRAHGISLLGNFFRHASMVSLYGIFCPIGILAVKNSMKNSHRGTGCVMLFGILMATGMVIAQFGILAVPACSDMIQNTGMPLTVKCVSTDKQLMLWYLLFDACRLIPLLGNDGLIIWRAWLLFYKRRWTLWMLISLWILTASVIVSALIAQARSMAMADSLLCVSMGLTFSTNLVATSLIGNILWGYWKVIKQYNRPSRGFQGRANVWKILLCLVEVGLVYCLLQLTFMIGDILTLPSDGTTEVSMVLMAFSPSYTMLSMFYPVIITLLLKGPSVMLGIRETAISIEESQVNRISIGA